MSRHCHDNFGLRDTWQECDLEAAIIREMEFFLLELGAGFSFVARQKRIQIDDEDFHLDLLFYNRKLQRLVAVELKIGEFAEYLTTLPPRAVLGERLQQVAERARLQIERRQQDMDSEKR